MHEPFRSLALWKLATQDFPDPKNPRRRSEADRGGAIATGVVKESGGPGLSAAACGAQAQSGKRPTTKRQ